MCLLQISVAVPCFGQNMDCRVNRVGESINFHIDAHHISFPLTERIYRMETKSDNVRVATIGKDDPPQWVYTELRLV
jgi:hypothetical protein